MIPTGVLTGPKSMLQNFGRTVFCGAAPMWDSLFSPVAISVLENRAGERWKPPPFPGLLS